MYFLYSDGKMHFFDKISELEAFARKEIETYLDEDREYHSDVADIVSGVVTRRVIMNSPSETPELKLV